MNESLKDKILDYIRQTSRPDSVDVATNFCYYGVPIEDALVALEELKQEGRVTRSEAGIVAWYVVNEGGNDDKQ